MRTITQKIFNELASHEGIVLSMYKDSVGVSTWGIGVTNASGHQVDPRYKDKPSTLEKAVEVSHWLMQDKYLPAVLKAFTFQLTETQAAAALSFHYNTGAIARATWVKDCNAGDFAKAEKSIMNWKTPSSIISRREKERDLFFHGKWSNNGTCLQYDVNSKYQPFNGKSVKIPTIGAEPPITDLPKPNGSKGAAAIALLTAIGAAIGAFLKFFGG